MDPESFSLKAVLQELWSGREGMVDPEVPRIIEAWLQVIPAPWRTAVCLEGFQDGILHVLVSHPAAAQQLQLQGEILKQKMNDLLGKPLIHGMRIRTGAVSPPPPANEGLQGRKPRPVDKG